MSVNEPATQESRGRKRIDVSGLIHAIDRRTGKSLGQLVNISEEGLMLQCPEPVPDGSIYQLSLNFESAGSSDLPVKVGVESLWSNSSGDQAQHWVGFHIIDISAQDLERIRQLDK